VQRLREERYKTEKRAYEAQQLQRQHIIDYITTFRTEKKSAAQDKKTPQVVSKQKQLDKMVLLENPDAESTDKFSLRFPDPGPLRVPLIAGMFPFIIAV
jgi:ATPase subunit of ABC transporter with duplicated ATPase domains